MKKFRLLVRTIHGNRVSSQLSLIDAAAAAAVYKHLCKPVEVIPDTRQLREAHGPMDKTAAAFAEDQIKKQGMNALTSGALMWDRQFCWKTLAEPTARVAPTQAEVPAAFATVDFTSVIEVSPERPHVSAVAGYVLGFALFAALHPVLAARYCAGLFWRWLLREQPGTRQEGFLRAPREEVESC